YYRLKVVQINLPPLRDRIEDVPLLVEHFINKYSKDNGKVIKFASPEALELMMNYKWPGNIRELENTLERAIVLADPDAQMITPDLLPLNIRSGQSVNR
ncbi:MAG TPA: Fis family transcriptional regulator, partial [Armatimonadota bacterium]|nr:Fis family transcriptional regulator [Armatimonadota bacterium]